MTIPPIVYIDLTGERPSVYTPCMDELMRQHRRYLNARDALEGARQARIDAILAAIMQGKSQA